MTSNNKCKDDVSELSFEDYGSISSSSSSSSQNTFDDIFVMIFNDNSHILQKLTNLSYDKNKYNVLHKKYELTSKEGDNEIHFSCEQTGNLIEKNIDCDIKNNSKTLCINYQDKVMLKDEIDLQLIAKIVLMIEIFAGICILFLFLFKTT
jgi:hypothetical protein